MNNTSRQFLFYYVLIFNLNEIYFWQNLSGLYNSKLKQFIDI